MQANPSQTRVKPQSNPCPGGPQRTLGGRFLAMRGASVDSAQFVAHYKLQLDEAAAVLGAYMERYRSGAGRHDDDPGQTGRLAQVCACVCMRTRAYIECQLARARERERECVCVCVFVCACARSFSCVCDVDAEGRVAAHACAVA
jgi:hypothetical protein